MALTKITRGVIKANENYDTHNINSTGIVTAVTFTGNVTGVAATFTGDVSIGGTLTYQDVTNIDSVGIITARAGVKVPDSQKIFLGDSDDLQIYHNGSHSYISESSGTGDLRLVSSRTLIRDENDANHCIIANSGGSVDLYHNGSKKFETTSYGAKFSDNVLFNNPDTSGRNLTWEADNDALHWEDNTKATFGAGNDLQIYHNGTHSYIADEGSGELNISGSRIQLMNAARSEKAIDFVQDGAVDIYYDGSRKFQTTSSGINVTGTTTSTIVNGTQYGSLGQYGGLFGQIRVGADAYGNTIKVVSDTNMNITANNNIYFNTGAATNGTDTGTPRAYVSSSGIMPNSDNSVDLGSSSLRWRNIYTADLQMSNEGSVNDVDGTWGKYTIQEGENDLFLINRRNGKKYKFNLTEVN